MQSRMMGRTDLPESVLSNIIHFLNPSSLATVSLLNRQWHSVAKPVSERNKKIYDLLMKCTIPHLKLQEVTVLSGGQTNQTFKVRANNNNYVVRLVGKQTYLIINREYEYVNASMASELGINAKIYYFDHVTGDQVSAYLDNAMTVTPNKIKENDTLRAVISVLKKVHQSKKMFANDINVFARNRHFLSVLRDKGALLPEDEAMASKMNDIEVILDAFPSEAVPAHNDTTCTNFLLLQNDEIMLLDWEYSGNNVHGSLPDLADVSAEADYTDEEDRNLLALYFGKEDESTYYRFILFKSVYAYYVSLWARVQIVNENYRDEQVKHSLDMLAAKWLATYYAWTDKSVFKLACQSLKETAKLEEHQEQARLAIAPFRFFYDAPQPKTHEEIAFPKMAGRAT
jgi:thiamine kinase-like enzyme